MNKGFTLIECIISIFILSIGIIGAFSVIVYVLSLTSSESSKLTALYLSQEGIEIVRNIRDTNYLNGDSWNNGIGIGDKQADYNSTDLWGYSDTFLNIETATGLYGYDSGTPTKFKRKIIITPIDTDIMSVVSEVSWSEKEQTKKVESEEYLYNWYYK